MWGLIIPTSIRAAVVQLVLAHTLVCITVRFVGLYLQHSDGHTTIIINSDDGDNELNVSNKGASPVMTPSASAQQVS